MRELYERYRMEKARERLGPLADGKKHIVRQVHTVAHGAGNHTTFVMTFCDDEQHPINQEDFVSRLGIERTVKVWRPDHEPCRVCAMNALRYVADLMPIIERAHEPTDFFLPMEEPE